MCVTCSFGVSFVGCGRPQPTSPTTSMSGSFQWPGPANFSWPFWLKPMPDMLFQLSLMSPVVRQQLPPTSWPHVHTSPMPYWHRL